MGKVFLSHSSKQKQIVEQIAHKLGKDNVVYDRITFEKGVKTVEEILKGLSNSDVFALFLSEEALESTWVQKEISYIYGMIKSGQFKSIIIFNLDDTINYSDVRIPKWITSEYNIQRESNISIISNKIYNKLLEERMNASALLQAKEALFAGRNDLVQQLEEALYSSYPNPKKCLVVSGLEGVGRRTFARKALEGRAGITYKNHYPIFVALDDYESIEDFIIKLANIGSKAELEHFLQPEAPFERKLEIAYNVTMDYINSNEMLFIIDNGAIIPPYRGVVNWFGRLLDMLPDALSFCIISVFRMSFDYEQKNKSIIHMNVPILTPIDRRILFNKYLSIHKCALVAGDDEFLCKYFNGMPEQIIYAADMILKEGVNYTKESVDNIVDYGTSKVKYVVKKFESDAKALDLLALVCQISYISYDYLKEIVGDDDFYRKTMKEFLSIGVYDNVGPAKGDIHVNGAVADYVQRNKIEVSTAQMNRLKGYVKKYLSEESEDNLGMSDFLATIKAAIISKVKIKSSYIIPSMLLKNIITKYRNNEYKDVITIAYAFLENKNRYDEKIVYDVTYTLCQSLSRLKDARFESQVKYFEQHPYQYFFLLGFSARMKGQLAEAKRLILKSLNYNKSSAQAKREMVNVLLTERDYSGALKWAHENYDSSPNNALHVQAYFTCLVKKHEPSSEDFLMMKRLLQEIKSLVHYKAREIIISMEAEHSFYIYKQKEHSIKDLEDYIKLYPNASYASSTLGTMYRSMGRLQDAAKLKAVEEA